MKLFGKYTVAIGFVGIITTSLVIARPPWASGAQEGGRPPFCHVAIMFTHFDADKDGALTKAEVPVPAWDHLSHADTDKDGKATIQEVSETLAARIMKSHEGNLPEQMQKHLSAAAADTDQDGTVSQKEFAAAIAKRLPQRPIQLPEGVSGPPALRAGGFGASEWHGGGFKRLDANSDGKISKDEILAIHTKADVDGDGSVTREELQKHIQKAKSVAVTSGKSIPSHGGRPSVEMIFGRFDKNKDGKLAKDEVPGPMWDHLSKTDADGDGSVSKSEFEKMDAKRDGR